MARIKNIGTEAVEISKEELLISYFRTLNEQGQDYILKTMDMVKDKYIKNQICFPTWRIQTGMSEKEYIENLSHCAENDLICLEFYQRNNDWRDKLKIGLKKQNGVIANAGVH